MAQINDLFDFIQKIEKLNINLDQEKCIKVRNRHASCNACMSICPAGCLEYSENKLYFSSPTCLSCGACVSACPTNAFSLKHPSDKEIYGGIDEVIAQDLPAVVFACEPMVRGALNQLDAKRLMPLTCLAILDESLLLQAVSRGGKKLTLVCGDCATCKMGNCRQLIDMVIQNTNLLLETWNKEERATLNQKFPSFVRKSQEEEYDEARRHFFQDIRTDARSLASNSADFAMEKALGVEKKEESIITKLKVNNAGTLPIIASTRRAGLMQALDSFGTPRDVMINTGLWSQVQIDLSKCRSCRICSTFCPTNALFKFHTKSGKIGVKQIVRDCINCHCCEDVCLSHALLLCDTVFSMDIADGREERFEMEGNTKEQKFTFGLGK